MIDFIMKQAMDKPVFGIPWQDQVHLTDLDFADDIVLEMTTSTEEVAAKTSFGNCDALDTPERKEKGWPTTEHMLEVFQADLKSFGAHFEDMETVAVNQLHWQMLLARYAELQRGTKLN
ncbi:hypothetical protein SRHO_G00289570 [Serrasalmus rhombeus]